MTRGMLRLWIVSACWALPLASWGEPVKRRMWILPVGEAPPFRQVVEDGVRRELPPPPGSIPPRWVEITAAKAEEGGEKEGEVDGVAPVAEEDAPNLGLALGRMSEPMNLPPGERLMAVREAKGADEPWLEFTAPAEGDFLVILWRGGETWTEPRAQVVRGGLQAGRVVFANVSPAAIGLQWQDARPGLKPGQVLRSDFAGQEPAGLVASVIDAGGRTVRLAQRSIEQSTEEGSLVVFYRADGWRPRMPVKMVVIRGRG